MAQTWRGMQKVSDDELIEMYDREGQRVDPRDHLLPAGEEAQRADLDAQYRRAHGGRR